MTADPVPFLLGEPVSWNRYTYTWGDPVNYVDTNGMLPAKILLDAGPRGIEDARNGFIPGAAFFLSSLLSQPGGPPPTPASDSDPQDLWSIALQNSNSIRQQTDGALDGLSHNCKGALASKGPGVESLRTSATGLTYFNAAKLEGTMPLSQLGFGTKRTIRDLSRQVSASRPGTAAFVPTIPNAQGPGNIVVPAVVILTESFSRYDAITQNAVLVHEALHYGMQLDDQGIVDAFGIDFGMSDPSVAITRWLLNDCNSDPYAIPR